MFKIRFACSLLSLIAVVCLVSSRSVNAQSFGIELHNNVMPASGAMAGTSLSRPQDNLSAINGNPATLTQYQGSIFTFGGSFIEPTYNVNQTAPLPLLSVMPYSAKSNFPPSILGNIGVTHSLEEMGMPITVGMGFVANAGIGVDFRGNPQSNGTQATYIALDLVNSVGIQLTDSLSVGGSFQFGTSFLDGPFVGSSSMQMDYAPRFSVGVNYDVTDVFSVGGFWQSEKGFTFEDSLLSPGGFQDVSLEHPMNYGIGIANRGLLGGNLLIAMDAIYKNWDEAQFFSSIYKDQWAFTSGAQLQLTSQTNLRVGYGYNTDVTRNSVPGTIGGVIPIGGIPGVQYIQGQFAAISRHRLTGGVGVRDMIPGIDFDLSLGGVFGEEKSFGATGVELSGYYAAFGFTWRRGSTNNSMPFEIAPADMAEFSSTQMP